MDNKAKKCRQLINWQAFLTQLGKLFSISNQTGSIPVRLTVNGGTLFSEGAYAIINHGTLTVDGGTLSTVNMPAIHNEGTLTVNGGTFTSFDPTEYVDMTTHTVTQAADEKWTVTAK